MFCACCVPDKICRSRSDLLIQLCSRIWERVRQLDIASVKDQCSCFQTGLGFYCLVCCHGSLYSCNYIQSISCNVRSGSQARSKSRTPARRLVKDTPLVATFPFQRAVLERNFNNQFSYWFWKGVLLPATSWLAHITTCNCIFLTFSSRSRSRSRSGSAPRGRSVSRSRSRSQSANHKRNR